MEFKKILMPTDFSDCAHAALAHAIFLAQEYRAELHWLHAMVLHGVDEVDAGFPDVDQVFRRLGDHAAGKMDDVLGKMEVSPLLVVKAQQRAVAPAPAIVDYAVDNDIDLIVMGTHGRRGLRRFLLGSVAEEVLRTASCPVLTVHGDDMARQVEAPRRILVPFDFSLDSEAALARTLELATTFGSAVDLVHVVAPPITAGPAGMPIPGTLYQDVTRELAGSLAREAEKASESGLEVGHHLEHGVPSQRIADFAKELGSDLIVIGSQGLSGLRHVLLGSVAARVVRHAECPVLVLRRPMEFDEESDATTVSASLASGDGAGSAQADMTLP